MCLMVVSLINFLVRIANLFNHGSVLLTIAALAPTANLLFSRYDQLLERINRRLDINSEVQLLYWCWLMAGSSAAHVCLPW